MPRPGFVLEVDERTPPLLVHEGEGYRMQKFPLGTRVVYPPDPLPGIRDVNAAIRHALLHPLGDSEPLPELLKTGMKLTIAVDDISIPLPPMTLPDIRQRILEQVIELAARKGVEDVQIVVATALHRRMTADEIRRMVGERELALIKPGTAVVNVSRGPIFDPDATIARLQRGDISGAFDVWDPEPIPSDSPIRQLRNVVLTPHISSQTRDGHGRFFKLMVDELERFFHGHDTLYDLTPRTLANRFGQIGRTSGRERVL